MNLDKRTVILTGASGGLGRAIAKALIDKGAIVYGIARNGDALNKLRETLGNNFNAVQLDLTHESDVDRWVKQTFSEAHCPDVLINNAGAGSFSKIDETPSTAWLQMVDINLNGMFYITSRVAALMKKNPQLSYILNIGSILGKTGRHEGAAYCATKFGVLGFTDALFIELRPFNIKVSCINPGSIETDFFKTSGIEPHTNMLHPVDLANTVIFMLETPDNMLINDMTIRPLDARHPAKKG